MENTQLSDLKNRLEALLFSSGKPMHVEELSRITKERDLERIRNALIELKKDLEAKNSSIMLIQDGDEWKLSVREHYMPFVRKVVSQTELPRTILQTLAIVAYKAPVLQSQVIKIRTNKAYRHLDFLEEKGYISREKKGRTKLIKLTQKFFEYFDIPQQKLKERFSGFQELEKVIETKEDELDRKKGRVEIYETLETFNIESKESKDAMKEMLGGLEIYKSEKPVEKKKEVKKAEIEEKVEKETVEEEVKEEKPKTEAKSEAPKQKKKKLKRTETQVVSGAQKSKAFLAKAINVKKIFDEAKKEKPQEKEYKSKGLFPKGVPKKIQKKIDKKVKEMVEGEENADSDAK